MGRIRIKLSSGKERYHSTLKWEAGGQYPTSVCAFLKLLLGTRFLIQFIGTENSLHKIIEEMDQVMGTR